jgi:hypothetical protein
MNYRCDVNLEVDGTLRWVVSHRIARPNTEFGPGHSPVVKPAVLIDRPVLVIVCLAIITPLTVITRLLLIVPEPALVPANRVFPRNCFGILLILSPTMATPWPGERLTGRLIT